MLVDLIKKYRELVLYGIFGVGATLINIAAFYVLSAWMKLGLVPANVLAWILAFVFAFVTNKVIVFESKSWKGKQAFKEMLGFFTARAGTGVLDTVLMYLLVTVMALNSMLCKVGVNVPVIVLNYIASKLVIFKKK